MSLCYPSIQFVITMKTRYFYVLTLSMSKPWMFTGAMLWESTTIAVSSKNL